MWNGFLLVSHDHSDEKDSHWLLLSCLNIKQSGHKRLGIIERHLMEKLYVILLVLVADLLKPSALRKTYSLEFLSSDGNDTDMFSLVTVLVTQRTVGLNSTMLLLEDLRY